MSRECSPAIRLRTRRVASVGRPAASRTRLSRHAVASRASVRVVESGARSAPGQSVLNTAENAAVSAEPADGVAMAGTAAKVWLTGTADARAAEMGVINTAINTH